MRNRSWLFAIPFMALLMSPIGAQTGASVSGTVKDKTGKGVHAARLRVENVESHVAVIALTDLQGNYSIPSIANGKYEISAQKIGYETASAGELLINGPKQDVKLTLDKLDRIPVWQMRDSDIIKFMPDDDPEKTAQGLLVADPSQKTLIRDHCVRCHSLNLIMQRGRTRTEWSQILSRMFGYLGGYSMQGAKDPFLAYLTKYLGPGSDLPGELEKKVTAAYKNEVPEGDGLLYTEWEIPAARSQSHTAVPDKKNFVYFTEFGIGKIGRYDVQTSEFSEWNGRSGNSGYPHGLAVGDDGIVWFTLTPDLGVLDPKTGKFEKLSFPGYPVGGAIQVARNGIVWFGIMDGLGSYNPKTRKFHPVLGEKGMGRPYGFVQSKQDENVFWFCVESENHAGYLNVKTGQSKFLTTTLLGPKRPRQDPQGRVWFGYYEDGALGMIDPATMKLTDYPLPFRGSAYSVHVDQQGFVWAASLERGSFFRLDPNTKQLTEFPMPNPGTAVRDLWPDQYGNVWYVQFAHTHNKLTKMELPRSSRAQP